MFYKTIIIFNPHLILLFRDKTAKRQESKKQAFGFSAAASSSGFQIEPHVAIVVSLLYVGIVIILHMIGKYRKDAVTA